MMSSSLALVLLAAATAPAAPFKLYEAVEPHMGTLIGIKLYARDEAAAAAAFRAAFARIAELDAALSDYRPDSELNQLTRDAVNGPVRVSEDLFRVLAASQRLAEESGGAFDITLGPVIRLWREARKSGQTPTHEALAEAGARCGWRNLHLDSANRTVTLDKPNMQLDLGGIAKGYAADEALAAITRLGIRSALVAASGDLAFSGAPRGAKGWKIEAGGRVLELCDGAASTSGDTEQHLDSHGVRYSHIVDPATNGALTNSRAVTILARWGVDADALATAASILGPARSLALLAKYPDARIASR